MIKRFAFTLMVICSLFILSSCVHNVSTMITDYNGLFSVETPVNTYDIQNEDFNPKDMLLPEYNVHYTTTLCLVGPAGGTSYLWTATLVECSDEEAEIGEVVELGSTKSLAVYLKDTDIRRWAEYTLTLTVGGANNTEFTDTAELNVY